MKNRTAGIFIMGIAVLMGFIILSFNRALAAVVNSACSHGPTCPMWEAIGFQTRVGTGIMGFVLTVGMYLVFSREPEAGLSYAELSSAPQERKKAMSMLGDDENHILRKVVDAQGVIFQSELVEEGFNKVKVTRILDKLEGKNLVERRRHGMSNVVVLKH